MNGRQFLAIELLMSFPDSVVAEMLGIRLATLSRWATNAGFADAIKAREREQARSLARIARQAALKAAASLCQAVGDGSKVDPKVLLDVLKVSGAFEPEQTDPGEALAEVIRRAVGPEEAPTNE